MRLNICARPAQIRPPVPCAPNLPTKIIPTKIR